MLLDLWNALADAYAATPACIHIDEVETPSGTTTVTTPSITLSVEEC